jgi:hypothetical protein
VVKTSVLPEYVPPVITGYEPLKIIQFESFLVAPFCPSIVEPVHALIKSTP